MLEPIHLHIHFVVTYMQIARMEAIVLKALDFNLLAPTIDTFLQRYLRVSEVEQEQACPLRQASLMGSSHRSISRQCSLLAMVG